MTIELSLFEYQVAVSVAVARRGANRAAGTTDKLVDAKRPGFSNEILGVLGELAFCKAFNLWPDLEVGVRSGSADCVLPNGRRIDVKSTRLSPGIMLVGEYELKLQKADIYVLVSFQSMTSCEIVGWLDAEDVARMPVETRGGRGYHRADRPTLREADELSGRLLSEELQEVGLGR